MLRLRFRAPNFGHLLDVPQRRARLVGRRAGRTWRRARSHPSSTLAAAAALVMVVSLVAVGTLPEVRQAVREVAAGPKVEPRPRVGELAERATETSATRRNKDGTFTTTVFGGPVNYRGSDRAYHRIDTALHPDGRDGYAWRSGANSYTARFKSSLDSTYQEFTVDGQTFHATAVGGKPHSRAHQDGSTVTWCRRSGR